MMPKKYFSQNFLIDKNILKKIINSAELKKTVNVLEVGPGLGFLTAELAERTGHVLAVEKDKKLSDVLAEELGKKYENLKIKNIDILKIPMAEIKKEFGGKPYKIVANLPYNITSNFIRRFLECDYPPEEMILMIQKEVAQRILARAGDMNLLSLAVRFSCEPKILFSVSHNCFFPVPKVESAVIRLGRIRSDKYNIDSTRLFEIARAGFGAKRKLLKSNLAEKLNIPLLKILSVFHELGLKETVRAQELSVEDWIFLARNLKW